MKKALFLLACAAGIGLQASAYTFEYRPFEATGGLSMGMAPQDYTPNTCVRAVFPQQITGWKLVGVRTSYQQTKGYLSSMDMWWSQNLWTSQPDGEVVPFSYPSSGDLCIGTFTTPKVLDGTPLYIGYNAVFDQAAIDKWAEDNPAYAANKFGKFGYVGGSHQPGVYLTQQDDGTWKDYSEEIGGAQIYAMIEAPADWQDNSVSVTPLKNTIIKKNNYTGIAIPVFNMSSYIVTALEYNIAIDGNNLWDTPSVNDWSSNSGRYDFQPLSQRYISLGLAGSFFNLTPGTHSMTITISKVGHKVNSNDQAATLYDNNDPNKSVTFDFTIVDDFNTTVVNDTAANYYNNALNMTSIGMDNSNYGAYGTFSGAIKFTADAQTKGMQIVGAKVDGCNNISMYGNQCLWLSSTLGDQPDGEIVYAPMVYNGTSSVTINFTNPVTLTEAGIYVGNSVDIIDYRSSYIKPIAYTNSVTGLTEGCMVKTPYSDWKDISDKGTMPITLYLKNAGSTEITEFTADGEAAQYFDLQGRQVLTPEHGIFIKRVGNKAIKVVK